jgi:hypothetical protein
MTHEPTSAVAVSIIGLWFAQMFGVPTPGTMEYISGMLTGIAGAFMWQFLKTQKAREDAAAKGIPRADLPRLDFYTLGLAMGGAPMGVGIMVWLIHMAGGTTQSWLSFGFFLGAGAAAPIIVPAAVEAFGRLATWLIGKVFAVMNAIAGSQKP